MIDPSEPKTSSALIANVGATVTPFQLCGTFVADEDLTLRQCHFPGKSVGLGDQIITTDPKVNPPLPNQVINEFQLLSQLSEHYFDLAFPVPKGKKLYYGNTNGTIGAEAVQLIFT